MREADALREPGGDRGRDVAERVAGGSREELATPPVAGRGSQDSRRAACAERAVVVELRTELSGRLGERIEERSAAEVERETEAAAVPEDRGLLDAIAMACGRDARAKSINTEASAASNIPCRIPKKSTAPSAIVAA